MNRKNITLLAAFGLTLALFLILWLGIQRQVVFVIDGNRQSTRVRAITVGGALKAAGLSVHENDVVQPRPGAWLKNGMEIEITHARSVILQVLPDGEISQWISASRTAAELLAEAKVPLDEKDGLWANGEPVSAQQELAPGAALGLVVRRAQRITLRVDGEVQTIFSSAATLGEALAAAGILLHPADRLTPAADSPLDGAVDAELHRAVELSIQADGGVIQARSAAGSVGEALAEAGVSLQGLDYSLPAEDQPIPANGEIRLVRVREELVLTQTSVAFTTRYENSDQVALDQQKILIPGVLGIQVSRQRVRFEDGQEVSRDSDGAWVAQEAQEQTVGLGTQIEIKTVQTPDGNLEYYRAVNVYVTSYSPCNIGISGCSYGTASGMKVQKGVVAVPRAWYGVLVGARVYIPGYGIAVVGDTGGMTGHWVDVAYSDADYVPWSQNVTMYFLTPVPAYVPVRLP